MNKGYFITIMITLITWIALTCLWAGNVSSDIESLQGQYNSFTHEIKSLNTRLGKTNRILWMHLPDKSKKEITLE